MLLGMEDHRITDQQITASSSLDQDHGPANARLNANKNPGFWSANTNDENQWIQVDFGRNVKIASVFTQGKSNTEWVNSFTLTYSEDGASTFQTYQENGIDKVLHV